MYIEDLTIIDSPDTPKRIDGPYAIGWLEINKPFPTGDTSKEFQQKLIALRDQDHLEYAELGLHECEWCDTSQPHTDTGIIFIQGPDYRWFFAPSMIEHYVSTHRYKPPQPFIDAVLSPLARMSEWAKISDRDLVYLEEILGKVPKSITAIEVRRKTGLPVVIRNEPIQKSGKIYKPFPTLYWLVDPGLNTQIADAERRGAIGAIEKMLASSSVLTQSHLKDNESYAKSRSDQLAWYDRDLASEHGFLDVLDKTGIGGVANHASVKCLHAQYAYHLASDHGTTVGRLMEEHFDIQFKL